MTEKPSTSANQPPSGKPADGLRFGTNEPAHTEKPGPLPGDAEDVLAQVTAVLIVKADQFALNSLRSEVMSVFQNCDVVVSRSGTAALAALGNRSFQVSVLGAMTPDLVWLDDLPPILKHPRAGHRLVIAGGHDARTLRALHSLSGVSIFDPTTEGLRQLRVAVETMVRRQRYLSASIRNAIARDVDIRPEEILSDTEERVLSVIGDGSEDSEAAPRLQMSVATVATHRKNIMRKLGLHRNAELMRFALKHGYVARWLDGSLGPGIAPILRRAGAR